MVSYLAKTSHGIFERIKRVYVDKRLPGMEYAQAGILYEPGAEFLVSYETIVAELTADGWVHIYGLFSTKTRKHLGKWAKMHGLTYYDVKIMYDTSHDYNIYTKQQRPTEFVPARTIGVAV